MECQPLGLASFRKFAAISDVSTGRFRCSYLAPGQGRACLPPKCRRGEQGSNTELLPPKPFVTASVQLAMVRTAQRHREFVADLARQRAALRKPEVVGISGAAGTDETGLGTDELQVITVSHSQRLPDRD